MKNLCFLLLASASILLAGCARVATTTAIKADGSFSRKVVYTVSLANPTSGSTKPQKPEDLFKIPSGPGIKVDRTEDEKKGIVITTTREVAVGAPPLQDIALMSSKGKTLATSTVKVTKLPDGKIEYTETLHSVEPTGGSKFDIPKLRDIVKKALPIEYQKSDLIDRATHEVFLNVCHVLLGPPDPQIFRLITNQDAGIHQFTATAFYANVKSFEAILPGVSDEVAKKIARDLTKALNQSVQDQSSQATPPGGDNSEPNAMTPLFFAISFPGKIVESNGIEDPITGEIYWSLLGASVDTGDIVLRVVVQP
jgi:hypothetical protein